MSVIGWKLDTQERSSLLERFPPEWPDVIADHITLKLGADGHDCLPSQNKGNIVGVVSDGNGLQTMIVAIAGETDRPDGSTFHILVARSQPWPSSGRKRRFDCFARMGAFGHANPDPDSACPVLTHAVATLG
ncbi:hypothetical protein QUC32_03235 [Novosphingobium resinovorum]|uniref:hypothetical protein n=1 Tax=Novosphingobium TaxID=165696 RepID=UPI0020052868|nr:MULTISPECIES: hypothetical protein [Novosphingobium]WJM25986.1 hypothetical protein QUC32_03235 [Novosphingobium resinovorum]